LASLEATFGQLRRILRPGGRLCLVIGESAKRERVVEPVQALLTDVGFKLEFCINRRVSQQRRQAPSINNEHLLVLSR
jgi:predicted methyltransferase